MEISRCLEYKILPLQFYIFTLSGVWCPRDWKPLTVFFYNVYTTIQLVAGVLFWLTIFINITITRTNSDFFYENIFAISTLTYAMYKQYFVLRERKKLENLLETCVADKWFKPQNMDELEIIKNYEYETRWISQLYALGIVAGLATKAIMPMIKPNSALVLPIEAWYPYDTNNLMNYFLSYIQQLMGGIPLICLHISVDTLFVGLVLQICIQLKLLKHRLQSFAHFTERYKNEEEEEEIDGATSAAVMANYARKHADILQFGHDVNIVFKGILTGQVMITIPNICINVYLLSQFKDDLNLYILDVFLCLATCMMEIFLYCWYGNKAILQSLDVMNAAYEMNWTSLNVSSKKKLLTIMIRATRTMKFAAGTFVMNIQSFLEILKTSYSAFRVLQKT